MLFNNLVTLVASASLVAALPGYGQPAKSSGYEAPPPEKETGTCTACMYANAALYGLELTLHSCMDDLQCRRVRNYLVVYQD
jgi:hypothetical protein